MLRPLAVIFSLFSITTAFAVTPVDTSSQLIVSVRDQKLMFVQNGGKVATYPVSTSMFGLGDSWGRMTTPLGYLAVEKKIGDNAPVGAVFHNRRLTGEILQPNAPGRDPVTTRIIWLRGLEAQNAHAFQRCIYIHGTPEETKIGRPASYGCIRMKASDIAALYDRVPPGTLVQIINDRLPKVTEVKVPRSQTSNGVVAAALPPQNQPQQPPRPAQVAKAPPKHSPTAVVAVASLAAPPEHLLETQREPQSAESNREQSRSSRKSGTLTVDEMRMAGALAAQKQKPKFALGKRL